MRIPPLRMTAVMEHTSYKHREGVLSPWFSSKKWRLTGWATGVLPFVRFGGRRVDHTRVQYCMVLDPKMMYQHVAVRWSLPNTNRVTRVKNQDQAKYYCFRETG